MKFLTYADKIRFKSNIKKTKICWIWKLGKSKFGYGKFAAKDKTILAHRASYFIHKGKIGKKFVLHKCDNPICVRPSHLYLGTPKQNSLDMVLKGRQARGEKNCKAKVTEKFVIKLRKKYTNKFGEITYLARKHNLSFSIVQNIIRRRTWKHLSP